MLSEIEKIFRRKQKYVQDSKGYFYVKNPECIYCHQPIYTHQLDDCGYSKSTRGVVSFYHIDCYCKEHHILTRQYMALREKGFRK